ncbi:MAG: hypothetical protein WBZ36_10350 [Candidatus Nitrosopolaris sp.]|jgi:hypothetical protein
MGLPSDLFVRINLELKTPRNILNFLTSAKQCVCGGFNVITSYKSVLPFVTFGVLHNGTLDIEVLDKILPQARTS